jgi:thioredoxin-like negative regulator of GroEL
MAECASFLLDAGNWRTADKVLGLASIDEPNPELVLVKAKVMAYGGDLEGALALLRAHGPSLQAEKRDMFEGEVAESTGNLGLAEESYERALSLTPSDLSAALSLAKVRIKMGKHEEAASAADVAIGIDGREWEPYKTKADALSLLGKADDAARLNAKARRLLAATGLDYDALVRGS